jgi:hypothetical protein
MENTQTAYIYSERLLQVPYSTNLSRKCSDLRMAGVMLSLSTVHVIADSFEDLDGVAGNFPVASIFIICGVYLMSAAENLSRSCFRSQVYLHGSESLLLLLIGCSHEPRFGLRKAKRAAVSCSSLEGPGVGRGHAGQTYRAVPCADRTHSAVTLLHSQPCTDEELGQVSAGSLQPGGARPAPSWPTPLDQHGPFPVPVRA